MDVLFNNPQGVRRAVAAVLGLPLSQVKMGPHQTREGGDAGWPILAPIGSNPDPAVVAAWTPAPDPAPGENLTDVEIYKEVFVTARKNATLLIDTIKASVQDALVKSKAYSRSDATIQGVDFVFCHGDAISKYKEAGGHPAAASKLLSAFKSEGSVALFPWVKSVEAIFDQALTY